MKIFDIHGNVLAEGESFAGSVLECADLRGAKLSGMNFSGANLYCANLTGADMKGANFSGALVLGADLTGAAAQGTDFRGADFGCDNRRNGTRLAGLQIDGRTDFSGAIYDDYTVFPLGFDPELSAMKRVSVLSPEDCEALSRGELDKLFKAISHR